MTSHDRGELVTAYLAHARSASSGNSDSGLDWATDEVEALVRRDPDSAWPLMLEMIRLADNDQVLAYIAAGPLENLVVLHGPHVIDRIEAWAAADGKFRRALTGVWVEGFVPDDIKRRLETIIRHEPRL
jgi:hypothetical protein